METETQKKAKRISELDPGDYERDKEIAFLPASVGPYGTFKYPLDAMEKAAKAYTDARIAELPVTMTPPPGEPFDDSALWDAIRELQESDGEPGTGYGVFFPFSEQTLELAIPYCGERKVFNVFVKSNRFTSNFFISIRQSYNDGLTDYKFRLIGATLDDFRGKDCVRIEYRENYLPPGVAKYFLIIDPPFPPTESELNLDTGEYVNVDKTTMLYWDNPYLYTHPRPDTAPDKVWNSPSWDCECEPGGGGEHGRSLWKLDGANLSAEVDGLVTASTGSLRDSHGINGGAAIANGDFVYDMAGAIGVIKGAQSSATWVVSTISPFRGGASGEFPGWGDIPAATPITIGGVKSSAELFELNVTYGGIGTVNGLKELAARMIPEAPLDGNIYARMNGAWVRLDSSNLNPVIPEIVSFTVTPDEIQPGGTATLAWEAINADAVLLNGSLVTLTGSMQVSPTEDTEYTLQISAAGGLSDERAITLFVNDNPYIIPPQHQVTIGDQTWTNVNLGGEAIPTPDGIGAFYNNGSAESPANAGKLYTHAEALEIASLFPGWHLPSVEDYAALINYAGGENIAGKRLKATGGPGGTDDYGFAGVMGGYGYGVSFYNGGQSGYLWTTTRNADTFITFRMVYNENTAKTNTSMLYTNHVPLRLIKDA